MKSGHCGNFPSMYRKDEYILGVKWKIKINIYLEIF